MKQPWEGAGAQSLAPIAHLDGFFDHPRGTQLDEPVFGCIFRMRYGHSLHNPFVSGIKPTQGG